MPSSPLSNYLAHLRGVLARREDAEPTDGQLLERYLAQREECAFEMLMRRHGPIVLSVCRRVLGHEQEAEDAFQASFLALARKAASIRKGESVGSFLYGVAYRIAMKELGKIAQRRRIEEVLSKLQPSGECLRALRAVQVLEYTGTAEAREHLWALSKGIPEVRLTREAKAALERLGKAEPRPQGSGADNRSGTVAALSM